jgi:hypothetical protein
LKTNGYIFIQTGKNIVSRRLRLSKRPGGIMKKNIFVFAALLLAVSAVVFAQELKFDGYLNSGVGIVANDREGDEPYFKAFGVDSESNGFRFRLNGSFQNEAKNAGVRFRLQGQRTLNPYGYLTLPYLYGWVGFFENKLTLTGGLVDDGTWTSADWWWNDDTGEGLGLLIKAEPIKGLNLGFGAYAISQQSGGNNNALGSSLQSLGTFAPSLYNIKYTVNAAYTMPDVFRFGAIFRTQNKAGYDTASLTDLSDHLGREESMFLQAEFRLLAVKNLTAVVVGTFDKLEWFEKRGNTILSETFGYKLDNLNVGLNAVQFLYSRTDTNDEKVDYNPGLLFNPWVSYTLDKIVPRLDLVYFFGGQSKTALVKANQQWERRGFATVIKTKAAEDDYSVFSIRPSVKINLDSRIFLEIGDMINIDFAAKDGAYGDSGDANKKTLFTNVFYIDVKFSY